MVAKANVATWEGPWVNVLTAAAAVLTAAGGLGAIGAATGVAANIVRGSERVAFATFALLVLGIVSIVLAEWSPLGGPAKSRQTLLRFAAVSLAVTAMLMIWIPLRALGRDQRPSIDITVSNAPNPKMTGTVAAGGLDASERLAAKVFIVTGKTKAELVSVAGGANESGLATIHLDVDAGATPADSLLVMAWLPDRDGSVPDCEAAFSSGSRNPIDVVVHPTPYVSCYSWTFPPPADRGPRVAVNPGSSPRTLIVSANGRVMPDEAMLLTVWDRLAGGRVLHSSLIYPAADGAASSTITVQLGPDAADVCAVAIQGATADMSKSSAPPSNERCRIDGAELQGWSELFVPAAPAPSPSASAAASLSASDAASASVSPTPSGP